MKIVEIKKIKSLVEYPSWKEDLWNNHLVQNGITINIIKMFGYELFRFKTYNEVMNETLLYNHNTKKWNNIPQQLIRAKSI